MAENKTKGQPVHTGLEIAVIGMAGRFPGARNVDEFWENLKNGVESISFFSGEELVMAGEPAEIIKNPGYVGAGGVLEEPDFFDASFFGYTPVEAEIMNPQMRLFHECTWSALEDAGYNPESYNGSIGIYAGAASSFFWEGLTFLSDQRNELGGFASLQLANATFLCSRISYNFNLKGPSSFVQTACSTSLVAIHWACRAVLSGECDMALAGGIGLNLNQRRGYMYEEGMVHSPDGHCRTFDAAAKGTIGGNGVGAVVLKRLKRAIEDRDHIYALVKGTAINNDGKRKVGYTAPSVQGQLEVIRTAQKMARIETESIGYIEAHGTATPLGDPVEVEALTMAFNTGKRNFCPIGSVKSNIGHLDTAAGVAGFIKTVLALKNRAIPPSLHFKQPNPKIDFENSPFYVNREFREWRNDPYPLRAGVSSFGIGGTNVHAVLEEAPPSTSTDSPRRYQLSLISAMTEAALDKKTEDLVQHLLKNPGLNLADAAYTLQVGRKALPHRKMAIASSAAETAEVLSSSKAGKVRTAQSRKGRKTPIFMFAGLGSQYENMAADLYRHEPVFRREADRCFSIVKALTGIELKEVLYPGIKNSNEKTGEADVFHRFETAQLVVFTLEYALARLVIDSGIMPEAMIGYSLGEYTAACISGVFSLEDALTIIVARGRLVSKIPTGTMLSAPLTAKELKPLLNEEIAIAIDNGPSCILAGPDSHLDALQEKLKKERYLCMRLPNSHAIHSRMMEPILKEFEQFLGAVTFKKPEIPYISNVTGQWISDEEAADPGYWRKHLSQTVRFADGIGLLKTKPQPYFIEIGPGRDLSTLLVRHTEEDPEIRSVNLIRPAQQDVEDDFYLMSRIGRLWINGVQVDWNKFHQGEQRFRIPLPTYPFEKQKFSLGKEISDLESIFIREITGATDTAPQRTGLYYTPSWQRSPAPGNDSNGLSAESPGCWLVFVDQCGLGAQLAAKLKEEKQQVVFVRQGEEFSGDIAAGFTIQPGHDKDYEALFKGLDRDNAIPDKIVHLWGVTNHNPTADRLDPDHVAAIQETGFYSLLNIAWALGKLNPGKTIEISAVTDNMHNVNGEGGSFPAKTTVLGPIKSIPLEYPDFKCRGIDLSLPEDWRPDHDQPLRQLFNQLTAGRFEQVTAFRGSHCWLQTYTPIQLEKTGEKSTLLRQEGVYLITGGLGGIGLLLAEYLAKQVQAKLVLVGRTPFPDKQEWQALLNKDLEDDAGIEKIKRLQAMENNGAEVLVLTADVTDEKQMRRVMDKTLEKFDCINGVIHAAGLPDGELIRRKKRKTTEKLLAAKINGTLVLDGILKDIQLDFFMLCSSTVSIQAGIGQAGYCAANNFLDAFAKYRFSNENLNTVSINWDRWRNVGITAVAEKMHKNLTGEELTGGISLEQGVEAFNRILDENLAQVVVTPQDPMLEIEQTGTLDLPTLIENIDKTNFSQPGHKRPDLDTEYIAPRNELEQKMTDIWTKFFGFQKVGVRDDFFDLGGDSLRAMVITSKIHKELNIEIPFQELFNSPTIEGLTGYISTNTEKSAFISIEPVEEKEYYPLASAQKRLYIIQQMDLGNISYNQPSVFILEGQMDGDRFEAVFREMIKRHEGLRTSFQMINGKPVQKIHEEVEFEIEYYDPASTAPSAESGEEHPALDPMHVESAIKRFICPFDLSNPPLLRVGLIEIEPQKHLIMVDIHHIIVDGMSIGIFRRDFMAIYEEVELPPLLLRYRDFSEWQNQGKEKPEAKKQEEFWLKEFAGEIPVLNLPWDYPRPAVQSFRGGEIFFELSLEETHSINEIAREQGATLFMVLMAIYNIFLSKLSGQEDIVVGVPIAGRRHTDLEMIIGMFVNTLPLRNQPTGEKTFAGFLRQLKENTLGAFENQDYPFEDIVDEAAVERDLSRNPLFDTMFTLLNMIGAPQPEETPDDEREEKEIYAYNFQRQASKVDLDLVASENEGKINFTFTYCSKLFEENTIQRFVNYLLKTITSVIENRETKLAEIEILPDEEKSRILFDFNDTEMEYPKEKTIHQLFEEQVERAGEQCSVVDGKSRITYGELNQRANRLAYILQEKGVGPGMIVAIMMDRSVELVTGILGILKAGGAYLPIDPDSIQNRIDYMLKDSSAKMLLKINDIPSAQSETGNSQPADVSAGSDQLAYIIYTSGSTGRPKGVMMNHRGVVNYVWWAAGNYVADEDVDFPLYTSIAFDLTVTSLFVPLVTGNSIVIYDEKDKVSLIQRVIGEERVGAVKLTPSHLNLLKQQRFVNRDSKIKRLVVGGEQLDTALARDISRQMGSENGDIEIYNEYGPTEAAVGCMLYRFDPEDGNAGRSAVPIGGPAGNVQIYILDKYLLPVPEGVSGELYISGDGVARGYLNRPELTAEKFIQLTLNNRHLRLYRTGDLAKRLPDGNLEFLGRLDHQVKIRGFRIEPEEIENRLMEYPGINEAVVICLDDKNGDNYLCAYIVSDRDLLSTELREYLLKFLPDYMIPSHFFQVEKIPLTPNGKIDRKAMSTVKDLMKTGVEYVQPAGEAEEKILEVWKEVLELEKISINDNFFEIGGNSLHIITINKRMTEIFGKNIPVVIMFSYPTIRSLANYLNKNEPDDIVPDKIISKSVGQMEVTTQSLYGDIKDENKTIGKNNRTGLEIAVIGMAGSFPGARNIHQYWENLKNGVESITHFSDEQLERANVSSDLINNPDYVKRGAILDDPEYFDASFFGYTPGEAEIMNPEIRLFHECAWHALEDAGYNTEVYDGSIGLYAGASSSFLWEGLSLLSGKNEEAGEFAARQLTDISFLPTRVAYKLNLRGPSSFVQTACSTSLVAIHWACRSVLSGECDMALAGGIGLNVVQGKGYLYKEGMVLSPDGHCRAFDAEGKGTVGGSGLGVVVLKRLENAIEDRDHIYAIVKGTAINNDGNRKVGYTAPSVHGQVDVIRTAQAMSHIESESIGYIETHGTATPLGDPVEIEALTIAFNTDKRNYCPIGSVKTNFGHLDTAAGVAGFIKTVLALKNRAIPPSLHFKEPNPKIDFKNSPFYVNTELSDWKNDNYPLRAGVSSFGIGGTNAHVVLEEAPQLEPSSTGRPIQLLLLSAKTQSALDKKTEDLVEHLNNFPGINLADAAYTMQVGRKILPYRKAALCGTVGEAVDVLSSPESGKVHRFVSNEEQCFPIFMFAGLGSQYVNMGADLYRDEPVFRREADHCFSILKSLNGSGPDLKEILYPDVEEAATDESAGFHDFETAQSAVFVLEYCLAKLIMDYGIKPHAMVGYSLGEYTAACLSGVFSLEDALKLIVERGRLVAKIPTGTMLSAPLTAEELKPILKEVSEEISIAIDNGPSCILAGPDRHLDALQDKLKENRYLCMRLPNSHAIHSGMMTPVLKEFEAFLSTITFNKPQIPYVSNVTGQWISVEDASSPLYWCKHLTRTVRFAEGVELLKKKANPVFIEIGPGRDLSTLLVRHKETNPNLRTVNLIRPSQQAVTDNYYLLSKIGQLWLYGISADWEKFHQGDQRGRIPLPTYPFQRRKYWIESSAIEVGSKIVLDKNALQREDDMTDWFYAPSWTSSPLHRYYPKRIDGGSPWLVFHDETGLGEAIADSLRSAENGTQPVVSVNPGKPGTGFTKRGAHEYDVDPLDPAAYDLLVLELENTGQIPRTVIHTWSIQPVDGKARSGGNRGQSPMPPLRGLLSQVYLARTITQADTADNIRMMVLTRNLQDVTGCEELNPDSAITLAAVKIMRQEYPNLDSRSIDIQLNQSDSLREPVGRQLIDQLIKEFSLDSTDTEIAFRQRGRWVRSYTPLPPKPLLDGEPIAKLKEKGVYLITGGLGRLGMTLASYLAEAYKARLVLTGRSPFPSPGQWQEWLDSHDENDETSRKIKELRHMENQGAEILVKSTDAADEAQMSAVIAEAESRFAPLNGVIHATGTPDEQRRRLADDIDEQYCAEQFQPNVLALPVLEKVLQGKSIDFCIIMSSLSSVLGGFGFSVYSAANMYMAAFTARYNKTAGNGRTPWIIVNWDHWDFTRIWRPEMCLTPEEGIQVFRYLLSQPDPQQVVIAVSDLKTRIRQWVERESPHENEDAGPEDTGKATAAEALHNRSELQLTDDYVPPAGTLEERIALLWQNFFGVEPIGVNDDFFELGGDSLRAMALVAKMHKELNVKLLLAQIFKTPRIRPLAEHIESTAQKGQDSFKAIEPAGHKEYYALSSVQKRLYILQQLEPNNTAYNIPYVLYLSEEMDSDAVEETFRKLIRRHESYRTSIEVIGETPVQKIHDDVEFHLDHYDGEIEEILLEFVRPFNLSQAPFLRAAILNNSSTGDRLLLIDIHHIITDAVSEDILKKEFSTLYFGEQLPPLKLQYKDYSEWQLQLMETEFIRNQKEFWLKDFAGEIPVLNLPWDYPRPSVQSFEGRDFPFQLGPVETAALNKMAQAGGATLFMMILAVYYVFLAKLSGQEDLVVGTPIAGRSHADLERIIGMFVNTLPLRNRLAGEKTFTAFLEELKEKTLEAFENQDYQFENIVEEVDVERDLSRNPLFDAMFNLLNVSAAPQPEQIAGNDTGNRGMERYSYERQASKVDLDLTATEHDGKISFILTYCTKLFTENTIERFVSYFRNIIASIIDNPEISLAEIQFMPEEEKRRILFDFNDTASEYPKDKTIHQLFEEQVERSPDQCALMDGESRISYRQLNRDSRRIAAMLQQKGIGPDAIVAIMASRSVQLVTGIFGILKAGAAYLPIDPDSIRERIDYMQKDSGAALLLTGEEITRSLKDTEPPTGSLDPEPVESKASDLAYIIYTSGSTGKPKGVMMNHRGAVNYIWWAAGNYVRGEAVDFPLYTSIAFDLTVTSLFVPLITGNTVVIYGELDNVSMIRKILEEDRVGVVKLTPSHLNLLKEQQFSNPDSKIKRLVVGGEQLDSQLAADITRQLGDGSGELEIYNEYGPTEAAVGCMIYRFDPDGENAGRSAVPIGTPAANAQIYILDKYLQPVPQGVGGELFIAGDGLARGYLNRPELSAEKFVNPTLDNRHVTLYRTGDLARRLPDGNLEFLGRIDHQVKIRGFRIEPGEIEAQILLCPGIEGAVVIDRQNKEGKKFLCAYVVTENEPDINELKTHISNTLPDYMIPSYFIRIEKIPLTHNGKIDRKALENISVDMRMGTEYTAPRNEIEQNIARAWQKVLQLEKVGIHENFFDVGGASLDIIKLSAEFKEIFSGTDTVVQMFRYPTIGSFAEYITQLQNGTAVSTQSVAPEIQVDRIKDQRTAQKLKRKRRKN